MPPTHHTRTRARADKRTTDAWLAGLRFTEELALLDLVVYRHDRLIGTLTLQGLADRWLWTSGEVAKWLQASVAPVLWPHDLREAV